MILNWNPKVRYNWRKIIQFEEENDKNQSRSIDLFLCCFPAMPGELYLMWQQYPWTFGEVQQYLERHSNIWRGIVIFGDVQ